MSVKRLTVKYTLHKVHGNCFITQNGETEHRVLCCGKETKGYHMLSMQFSQKDQAERWGQAWWPWHSRTHGKTDMATRIWGPLSLLSLVVIG